RRHARRDRVGAAFESLSDLVGEQARTLELGGEIGDAMAQRLKCSDWFAELLAFLDVCDGVVKGALADAKADRRTEQPLAVETGHDLREPSPDLANDALGGYEAVGEEDVVYLTTPHC